MGKSRELLKRIESKFISIRGKPVIPESRPQTPLTERNPEIASISTVGTTPTLAPPMQTLKTSLPSLQERLWNQMPLTGRDPEIASTSIVGTTPPLAPPMQTLETSLFSLQERLWNRAYDELKTKEPKAVNAYETILSNRLRQEEEESPKNEISKDPDERCRQMKHLVQDGLERTRKEASIKHVIGKGLDVVQSVKEIVNEAIQAVPQAAIAWTSVCICLEILSKPITEARSNREGITYVVSKMNWYWNLAHLLLDQNKATDPPAGLRDEMENRIVELYKKILLYQINSVCLYNRNQLVKIGRDVLSLDDWPGQLSDIEKAESLVKEDMAQYSSEQMKEVLSKILASAVLKEEKLGNIALAIQNQTQRQEQRFHDEKDQQCLKDFYETNPEDDKKNIQDTKGDLLKDSYSWILDHAGYKQFRGDPNSRLLWIKGDPGKGKTMLLCGIIDELRKEPNLTLSYFFCQATEAKLSNATSILRGLMYLLILQQPPLLQNLRKRYDITGEKLFQGANFWGTLVDIFTEMLSSDNLGSAIFIVDALDECTVDRHKLLDFIVKSSDTCRAKWIVSGRNWEDIDRRLRKLKQTVGLHLELNQELISKAVDTYITYKVNQLAEDKEYEEETKDAVMKHLTFNAQGTFLWVALVCKELADPETQSWHTINKLTSFPPGLKPLYKRMMDKIEDSADAKYCKEILAIISTVYRPIRLQELKVLSKSLEKFPLKDLRIVITCCGSFLTLRQDTIVFIHQSAKDYLLEKAAQQILPFGLANQHHGIFSRSLEVLSKTLRRDICDLSAPGVLIDEILPSQLDVLTPIAYASVYWIDHLGDSKPAERDHSSNMQDNIIIVDFMKNKYVYWLECLSLLRWVPEGIMALLKLEGITRNTKFQSLEDFLEDARRFILSHKQAIKTAPLQVYASALIFSPVNSLIKQRFKSEEFKGVTLKFPVREDWDECLQILGGHSKYVSSVAFSHDSRLVATSSDDKAVRIWNADTGECLHALEQQGYTRLVEFSHDSMLVISCCEEINVWRTDTGERIRTLNGHTKAVESVAFSHDSELIVSASADATVKIWRTDTGKGIKTLNGHTGVVNSVAFSHDSKLIASGSYDKTVRVWSAETGECIRTLKGHINCVASVAFSHDSQLIASASGKTVRVWRAGTGECIRTLVGHSFLVTSVAFSHGSRLLASGSSDNTMRVWSADSGECVQMQISGSGVTSVAFSHDSTRIASGSRDGKVRIWRVNTHQKLQALNDPQPATHLAISQNSKLVATTSGYKGPIRIWHVDTGKCIQTIDDHIKDPCLRFEENDTRLIVEGIYNYKSFPIPKNIRSIYLSADVSLQPSARLLAHHAPFELCGRWVTLDGERMIQLPLEHSPSSWVATKSIICIGDDSGFVILGRPEAER
ncbi:hypothetical protein V8C35DRAFT_220486 [Trichoderma chlorosporum]